MGETTFLLVLWEQFNHFYPRDKFIARRQILPGQYRQTIAYQLVVVCLHSNQYLKLKQGEI